MNRLFAGLICTFFALTLAGCPVPVVSPGSPGSPGKIKPRKVPPGQVRRQQTPSGPKKVPPGQMKKAAPGVVVIAPPLPPIVELDVDLRFFHEGFHYFFVDGIWFYADRIDGPRLKLPKERWPKEVRHKKGKKGHKDKKKGK